MFEAAILRMGLSLDASSYGAPNVTCDSLTTAMNEHGQNTPRHHGLDDLLHPETLADQEAFLGVQNGSINDEGIETQFDIRDMLPMTGNYDWIESLLTPRHPQESQLRT